MAKTKLKIKVAALLTACVVITACSQTKPEAPSWQLDTQASQLSFISTKNKEISETHTIPFIQGSIVNNTEVSLTLDLNQVESQIDIRNQRMKGLLFETAQFPTATIQSSLPQDLPLEQATSITFDLDLHGIRKTLQVPVIVQHTDNSKVVTNFDPIIIHAKDFGLDKGINQLTQVAKLKAISYEVPVDFKLVFNKIKSTNH